MPGTMDDLTKFYHETPDPSQFELFGPHADTTGAPPIEPPDPGSLRNLPERVPEPEINTTGPTPIASGAVLGSAAADAAHSIARGRPGQAADYLPLLLSVFAGPRAKGANLANLERAKLMEARGAGSRHIWDQTGWWNSGLGATGEPMWTWRIPNEGLKYNESGPEGVPGFGPGARIEHPGLQANYPDAANATIPKPRIDPSLDKPIGEQMRPHPVTGAPGYIEAAGKDPRDMLAAVPHEGTHLAQAVEGWDTGLGTPDPYKIPLPTLNAIMDGTQPVKNGSHYGNAMVWAMRDLMENLFGAPKEATMKIQTVEHVRKLWNDFVMKQMRPDKLAEAQEVLGNQFINQTAHRLYRQAYGEGIPEAARMAYELEREGKLATPSRPYGPWPPDLMRSAGVEPNERIPLRDMGYMQLNADPNAPQAKFVQDIPRLMRYGPDLEPRERRIQIRDPSGRVVPWPSPLPARPRLRR